jgi:hypothetical protein
MPLSHRHCLPARHSVGGCLFPVQAQLGARTLIVVGTQHLTGRGIDQVMAVAGQAHQGLLDIVPVVGVDFFSNPTLDVPAGCRAAIEKGRHCIRLGRFGVSALTSLKSLHAQLAQVAERHCGTGRLLGVR